MWLQRLTLEKADGAGSGGNENERRHAEDRLVDAGASDGEDLVAVVGMAIAFPTSERVGRRGRKQTTRPDEDEQQYKVLYTETEATDYGGSN